MTITVPIKLVSEANLASSRHWRYRSNRTKAQRQVTAMIMRKEFFHRAKPSVPCTVTIVRIAPRELDDDNLAGSGKHVRDEIAAFLGVDDKPGSGVTWRYEQRRGKPREYACEIRFEGDDLRSPTQDDLHRANARLRIVERIDRLIHATSNRDSTVQALADLCEDIADERLKRYLESER